MNKNIALLIGASVKASRQAQGVSQAQLANHLGVSRMTIFRWETQGYDIPSSVLLAISIYLNTPINQILEEAHGLSLAHLNRSDDLLLTRAS